MNWLTRPIELPPKVQRYLPKSPVRALAAAALFALWLRPNLEVSVFPGPADDGVSALSLRSLFPANLTVPLTALILLVSAWRGNRSIELLSILVLWLHAVVIATLVPLGLISGKGGIELALYVAMVSGLCTLLLRRPSIDTIIMRCGVGLLALILLFPVLLSHGMATREANPIYAAISHVFGSSKSAGPIPVVPASPAVSTARQGSSLGVPNASVPVQGAAPSQQSQEVTFSVAERCHFDGQVPNNLSGTTREAWGSALKSTSAGKAQIASTRQRLFQALVDAHLKAPASSWLSDALPNLQTDVVSAGLLTTMLPWDAEFSTSPDIGWTRSIVGEAVARYSAKRAEPPRGESAAPASASRGADSPAPADESDETAAGPADQTVGLVFPIEVDCTAVAPAANPAAWLYPMPGTTAGVPQVEKELTDGRVLVQLPLASIERAASIADFARFIGAEVSVSLAHRAVSELTPGEPGEDWEGLSWGVDVTANLPALVIVGDKLIPGRFVHAHGDDPCVSESSIDLLLEHSPGARITGLMLLADTKLTDRVTVLDVKSTQSTHDPLRSSRTVTSVDVTGDHKLDLTFQSVSYEVRAGDQKDEAHWTAGPWSWAGVATSQDANTPFEQVTYPGCERR